jgi:farnesyl diphosphate synthase
VTRTTKTDSDWLTRNRDRIEEALAARLPSSSELSPDLVAAMRYAVLSGGKRLRPLLVCATAESLASDPAVARTALEPACAIEFVHAYSLIHDDLPAMDDDTLRHGKPTCHVAFGEATAILAGDALQALAFETLLGARAFSAETRLRMARMLAESCGWMGMVGGQAQDIAATGVPLGLDQLERMHGAKSGALLAAAVQLGALAAGADAAQMASLARFGADIGLAFQIVDDVLDATATTHALGKTAGSDARAGKSTYPALLGIDASRDRASALLAAAHQELAQFGLSRSVLAEVATALVDRRH